MMVIVSENDDDGDSSFGDLSTIKFLQSKVKDNILNISCDYRYLKIGYYVSAHAEILGSRVIPKCWDILDAYRNPLFITRSNKSGIASARFTILLTSDTNENIPTPAILFALNPFTSNSARIIKSESELQNAVKSMSMNYSFPVSVQPLFGEVKEVLNIFEECISVSGDIGNIPVDDVTKKFYKEFKIPLSKLIIQITKENKVLLSHCEPIDKKTRKKIDWNLIREKVTAIKKNPTRYL